MTETLAVALVGETDADWLVEADCAGAAVDHMHKKATREHHRGSGSGTPMNEPQHTRR